MTDEDILKLGELATALLVSPEFKMLNVLFEQQVAADVLNTKPEDTIKREHLYATLQGSRAFTAHMQGFADDYARNHTIKTTTDADAQGQEDPGEIDIYDDNES